MITIYFKKEKSNAIIPSFGHDDNTNAGVDLHACIDKPIIMWPKQSTVISTGVSWYIDRGQLNEEVTEGINVKVAMILQSRSGLAIKQGVECSNAGVIDEGYTGEIKVKLYNNSFWFKKINPNDRVAQGIIEYLPMTKILELPDDMNIQETARSSKGFGSSGR